MSRRVPLLLAACLALSMPLTGCGEGAGAPAASSRASLGIPAMMGAPPQSPADSAAAAHAEIEASRRTAIVRAAERVAPGVVSISILRREVVRPRSLFESFFYGPSVRQVAGLGSGFIIREDGLVLTNEHVVRGADQVVVTLTDGREFEAEVVGTDEVNDVALVRIPDAHGLPVVPLGDSDGLLIGEWVVAIGNPLGYVLSNYEPTVTVGVISGVGRNIVAQGEDERGAYLGMIQTDASINPGNSGGPLVNALGEVVGINSSIISRSGGSEGLGFAIPINRARRIALDLLDDGRVRRAWVGIEPGVAESRQGGRRTVVVEHVAPGSPAAEAGLHSGVVLRRADGEPIRTPLDWDAVLLGAQVGQPLEVTIDEDGEERVLRLIPEDLPSVRAERIQALSDFELVSLTPSIRAERGIVSEHGALIVSLSDAARDIGLRQGDVILQINRIPIESAEQAARVLGRLAGRGPVRVFFERQGRGGSVSFYING
ncbi:MAG TPA: trypsin-like peptidase domain-containing protein [Longimicrobiales bacterium]